MKTRRQARILELIKENDVETQSELLDMLKNDGFHVTQATVSRDIKEMRLIKILSGSGSYKYASEMIQNDDRESHSYLFATAVISVESSHNLVVIKTRTGMAQAVCAALDATERSGVLGTIAGDDTIFVATRTDSVSASLVSDLKRLVNEKNNNNFVP